MMCYVRSNNESSLLALSPTFSSGFRDLMKSASISKSRFLLSELFAYSIL